MRGLRQSKGTNWLLALAALQLVTLSLAPGQTAALLKEDALPRTSGASICEQTAAPSSLKNAFLQVCRRKPPVTPDSAIPQTIIIGFVGGFVKHDDARHPEVQFAAYLRHRYPAGLHAEVFSNHHAQEAFRQVLRLLDTDHDGDLTATEKDQARIIIYGHSWGASQTVAFARELGQNGIPVLLTIQLDSIAKPGQNDATIPSNVASAANFYQPGGFLHGRSQILPTDPARTRIIGNFRMTYEHHPINCDNYPWFARTFNKPHHEIENDPRVWDQAAALIDSELSSPTSTAQPSSPAQSALLK